MATALSLITRAAQLIGAVRKGEALDADEAQDGLAALNDLLSSWSNSTLIAGARTLEEITLVSSATAYTIAEGATLNTARPIKIESLVLTSDGTDRPVTIVSQKEFERVAVKDTVGDSYVATYDAGYPVGVLRMYPLPSAGDVIRLLSEKQLTSVASLSTGLDLRPGLLRALRYNLAIELAPEYGLPVEKSIYKIAADSLRAVELAGARNRKIAYQPNTPTHKTIYTGYNA